MEGTTDTRFGPGGIWARHQFSPSVKSNVESRYYQRAAQNDDHFVAPEGPGTDSFVSSGSMYQQGHEKALITAYRGAAKGKPIVEAMINEAAAQHFLTDSFAAGHLTTERTSIGQYWNAKYPDFGQHFVDALARSIADVLAQEATGASGMIPQDMIEGGVRGMIMEQLAGKPLPAVGDIISLVEHDHDNAEGVLVVNDIGGRWKAFGDGSLLEASDDGKSSRTTNFDMSVLAVRLSNADVETAHAMGKAQGQSLLPPDQLFDQIRQRAQAPAKPGDKYAAEQAMPRLDPDAKLARYQWKTNSLRELWNTPIRKGATKTFGMLIFENINSGTMSIELNNLAKSLPKKQDPFLIMPGGVYPKAAFKKAVLDRIATPDDCLQFFLEIAGE